MDVYEALVWSLWVGLMAYAVGLFMAVGIIQTEEREEGLCVFVGLLTGFLGFFTATIVLWMLIMMEWL